MISSLPNSSQFTAAGKLMLFGEYLVLTGSKCLALPLKFGQSMEVIPNGEKIIWKSTSPQGEWFNCQLDKELNILVTNNQTAAERLQGVFIDLKSIAPNLSLYNNFNITANFNMNWGLGSSSTFISLISQWAKVDPYALQLNHFGGSGYDIAAATEIEVFTYSIDKQIINRSKLNLSIKDKILFVYLGKKQNTQAEIGSFNAETVAKQDLLSMNGIIDLATSTTNISVFEDLMVRSEQLLSPIIGQPILKEAIFADYKYAIKSLGAWGGDFFMATFRDVDNAKKYFKNKGYTTLFTYNEIAK